MGILAEVGFSEEERPVRETAFQPAGKTIFREY